MVVKPIAELVVYAVKYEGNIGEYIVEFSLTSVKSSKSGVIVLLRAPVYMTGGSNIIRSPSGDIIKPVC